jgi:hypothetical protein
MSDWVLIAVSMVMFVSLFGAIGLALIAWRRQSMIRGLEAREKDGLGVSSPVASDRVQALSARAGVSQGDVPLPAASGRATTIGVIAGVIVLLLAGGAAAWWFGFRGAGDTTVVAVNVRPANGPLGTDPDAAVPDNPPAIQDRAAYTVAVLNASGIAGAATTTVAPKVETAGYRLGKVGDANDDDLRASVVMWREGKQAIAQNVAKDLGITTAPPLDGVAADAIGDADVVVVVGKDAAASP